MSGLIVLANDALDGARILADVDALHQLEGRGWAALGPCSDRHRDPLRTDAEQADHDAQVAARAAAVLNPKPSVGAAAAASKPARAAASTKE